MSSPRLVRWMAAFSIALLATGCHRVPDTGTDTADRDADRTAREEAQNSVADIESGARIDAMEARIGRLEQQVAELQTPTASQDDDRLLRERLRVEEQALVGSDRDGPVGNDTEASNDRAVPRAPSPRREGTGLIQPRPLSTPTPRTGLIEPGPADPQRR